MGRMKASNTISEDVGKPGRPMTGLPPARAKMVGLPGRMSMPWNKMPGAGKPASSSAARSLVPTDEPPETMMAS